MTSNTTDSDGGVGLHFWEETKELQRDVYVKVEITSHPDDDGGEVFTETILDKYLDPSASETCCKRRFVI